MRKWVLYFLVGQLISIPIMTLAFGGFGGGGSDTNAPESSSLQRLLAASPSASRDLGSLQGADPCALAASLGNSAFGIHAQDIIAAADGLPGEDPYDCDPLAR